MVKRIIIIGGGFAGLWSAVGAARKLDELGIDAGQVEITLVNRDGYHSIRVRNYEQDLSQVRVSLRQVLDPVGIKLVEGNVTNLDFDKREITVEKAGEVTILPYDRLVLAAGSQLYRPDLPGLKDWAFSVDTYGDAVKLDEHLQALHRQPEAPGRYNVVIVGAGLTGIEIACEMPQRLREFKENPAGIRVILVDRSPHVGSDMGESARPVIEEALSELGIEQRVGVGVQAIHPWGIVLDSGESIPSMTIVWAAGMRASPLTERFPVERDRFGRLWVDEFLKIKGMEGVFAAGDCAWMKIDGKHSSVMSCQHGRPMGRFAGHNVICDLLGEKPLPLQINWYVTVLDLGTWGAVYTHGWERTVFNQGTVAKQTKQTINCYRIYPPLSGDRAEILAAATPIVQTPPEIYLS